MDKYEYKLKLDQLKSLVAEEDYEAAADIANSINWKKVRNSNTLCMVATIYEKTGQYDACRDVLLQAYDHSSLGRNIVKQLVEVAIKANRVQEAEEYYAEFVEIAPKDNQRYVIAYKISCLKNAPISDRIAILEELKEKEYTEDWAYELAALYAKADMREECVEICDELILWFGEGEYVEKALNLKRKFQPLTAAQEEKYQKIRKVKDQVEINLPKSAPKQTADTEAEEDSVVPQTTRELPEIKVTATKFNTVNLQEELAKSMKQIMNATERETVADTMESIKRIVNDIPYLSSEKAEDETATASQKITEEVDETLKSDFQEKLIEEQQADLSGSDAYEEHQVAGQLSIEEVLAEWEKTKRAAEAAIAAAEQKKLDMEKEQALSEANEIMSRLQALLPVLSATNDELADEDTEEEEVVEAAPTGKIETVQPDTAEEADSLVAESEALEGILAGSIEVEPDDKTKEMPDISAYRETETQEAPKSEDEMLEDILASTAAQMMEEQQAVAEEEPVVEEPVAEEPVAEEPVAEEPVVEEVAEETAEEAATEEPTAEEPAEEVATEEPAAEEPAETEAPAENASGIDESMFEPSDEIDPVSRNGVLSAEDRAMFSYFLPVPGVEEQIVNVLLDAEKHCTNSVTSLRGNIIVQGEEGCGKTVLATSLIKAIQKIIGNTDAKIGKISAAALNRKDFAALVPKIAGGYLIIDKAGELSEETANRMARVMEKNTQGMIVILEDDSAGIRRALGLNSNLAKMFTSKVKIPIFTIDELVEFGKAYAAEMECVIETMGVLALYNRINNIQKLDHPTTLAEVKDIVDEAIEKAESTGIKKLFAKKYNDNDYLILREKDFE